MNSRSDHRPARLPFVPIQPKNPIRQWHEISGMRLALNISCRAPINNCVKSLRTLLTLLLVALWPLAASHCRIEQLPGFDFLACAGEDPGATHQEDCETDSCATVESGLYKTEDGQEAVPTPPGSLSPILTACAFETTLFEVSSALSLDAVALGLLAPWQFSLRAALPPRAPSFVS